jgi:outer membrane immunogenic protein
MIKRLTAIFATTGFLLAASGSAFAADMAVKMPVKAPPPPPAPVYSWTGWYIGGNVGYGWGDSKVNFTSSDPAGGNGTLVVADTPSFSLRGSGALGGFQLGYNWQFNQVWLVGFESDFDFSDISGSGSSTNTVFKLISNVHDRMDWFGTVRGRLGYLPTNQLLLYGTGGFAYGRVAQNANVVSNNSTLISGSGGSCPAFLVCYLGASDNTKTGWTAGGGFEYALLNNVTLKAEYIYVNLGNSTVNENVLFAAFGPPFAQTSTITTHINDAFHVVRVGLNYQFH